MPSYEWNITYLNTTKQLVALSGGKLIFMKYNHSKKEYVKVKEVKTNYSGGIQNIGTDGQVIFVAESAPGGGRRRLWTLTLDGKVVEEHKFGSGFKGGDEVEAALSDNQGNLWLICPQYFHRVSNYRANPANATPGSSTETTQVVAPIDDFSAETKRIIMEHMNDFNEYTYSSFMKKFPGGYDGYMQSLGGVFAKYGGKGKKIQINNAGDLQEAAEFVWGLFSIWGFDYWNGGFFEPWGKEEEFPGLYKSAYYPGHKLKGGWTQGNINDICSNASKAKRTNCNAGIDSFLWTTTLENPGYGTKDKSGKRIDKKEDLQVGDLIHFYGDMEENDWHHVAIVGEIDHATGQVILYDSGSRFIKSGRYKIPLGVGPGTKYSNYKKWVGRRHYNIDQTSNRYRATESNSTYKVKVATWNYSLDEVTSDDSEVDTYKNEFYYMSTTTIPYQEIVSKYKMPFNYLWTMLVISEDKDYALDLAKLVEDSQIEITIHDNYSKSDDTETEYYTKYKKIYTTAHADVDYTYVDTKTVGNKTTEVPGYDSISTDVEETSEFTPKFFKKHHTINETITLDIALTLAKSWFVDYEKTYTYISPSTIESHPTETLEDINNGTNTVNGDFGGHREQLEKKAKNAIPRSYESASVGFSNVKSEYTNKLIERSKQFDNYYTSSRFVSSVPGGTGISSGYGSSVTKSGTLDKNNYDRKDDSKLKHIGGIQQGFCFIDDNLCAIVEKDSYREKSSVYLIDLNTMTQTDEIHNLIGHGNTIAYDKKTGDIIFPEDNDTALIHVDISTKKMEKNPKRVHTVADNSASVAYNSQLDMFVSYSYPTSVSAYTRDAFYNRGKESVRCSYQKPKARSGSGLGLQGCGSYGNHAYIIYSEMDLRSGNYIIVCNIKTGKAEKVINDDRVNGYPHSDYELEELDFKEDGTMYGIYGGGGINILERSYNYFSDTDIDKSNITPGAGTNSIAAYNTGGVYTEAGTFERVFNMHYKARKNILSVEEWLFEALENNKDTAGMVDLTKYLLYKATGISFGITEFDYEAYGMQGIGVGGATLSITSTTFTREQFVQLTQSYSGALSKGSRTATFRENAGIIYDVCVKNHINPVLCAAQGWKEQNWDDPNTSPFNFWGIAVYNGQNYGKSWGSMEQAVQGYCDQINSQLNGKMKSTYQARAQQFAPVNNKFVGDMSNIYDVFSAYAYIGDGHTLKEQADYAANYVDSLIKCATQIYGEGALTGGSSAGTSDVVQFALKYEGKTAPEFGLFNYTSKCGAKDVWANNEWCAMFVSFCFDNCNKIPNPLTQSYASCADGWGLMGSRQRNSACRGGNYIPKSGDIIFFGSGAGAHTGIVIDCDGSTVNTIEGNTGNKNNSLSKVSRKSRSINDGWIWGYGAMSN